MAYIDAAYYADTYKGKAIPSGDFPRLAERASEAAASMSMFVKLNGTATLTADELTALKMASCVMAEFYQSADSGAYSSEKIGSYSYTAAQSYGEAEKAAFARARSFLDAVGLTYSGERCRE